MTGNTMKWTAGAASTVIVASALVFAAFTGGGADDTGANPVRALEKIRGEEIAILTTAPMVPAPITVTSDEGRGHLATSRKKSARSRRRPVHLLEFGARCRAASSAFAGRPRRAAPEECRRLMMPPNIDLHSAPARAAVRLRH